MDCGQLTVDQLRAELSRRGLSTAGEVGELCARLDNALNQAPLDEPGIPGEPGGGPPPSPPRIVPPAVNVPTLKPIAVPTLKPIAVVPPTAAPALKPVAPVLIPPSPATVPKIPTVPVGPVGPAKQPPLGTVLVPTTPLVQKTGARPKAAPRVIQVVAPGQTPAQLRPLSPVRVPQVAPPEPTEDIDVEEEVRPGTQQTTFVSAAPRSFENMTVAQLRAEAKTHGLVASGTKAELIQRIRDYLEGKIQPQQRGVRAKRSALYARGTLVNKFINEAEGAPSWRAFYISMGIADLRKWLLSHGFEPKMLRDMKREELLQQIFIEIEKDAQVPDQHLDTPTIGCAGKDDSQ